MTEGRVGCDTSVQGALFLGGLRWFKRVHVNKTFVFLFVVWGEGCMPLEGETCVSWQRSDLDLDGVFCPVF